MQRTGLTQLLSQYSSSTTEEESYRERMLALLATRGDPFSRDHYQPGHFTCSSFVLSPDLSSLLLIYHAKLNRWLQPGGHADPGDTDVFASARREVMEETGVDGLRLVDGRVLFDLDIHNIPGRAEEPAHRHFDLRFLFLAPSWEATAGSDAVDFRWVGLAEVAVHESDASVMRAVEKLRRRFEAAASS